MSTSAQASMAGRSAVIHCNANLNQGMGHLMRSLTLAEEAKDRGWNVVIAGQFGGRAKEHAAALAPTQEVISLGTRTPFSDICAIVDDRAAQILHIDSYDTTLDTSNFGSALVSNMQDGGFGRRPADLHIDPNLDAQFHYRKFTADERAIVGTAGMQIRKAVRDVCHVVRRPIEKAIQVLVILGGTDPFELTPLVTQFLAAYDDLLLTVICRPETHRTLRNTLDNAASNRVRLIPFTEDLPELANSMDMVVTAAGTSVWDFAAAGIPMGIIAVTDNQLPGYQACGAHDLGIALGEPPFASLKERIAFMVEKLHDQRKLIELSTRGPALVDGMGAWRVVSAWEEMVDNRSSQKPGTTNASFPQLTARPAKASDAQLLFDWRNDASTRAASRTSSRLEWPDHVVWLNRTIADPNRHLLIVENELESIATARWDRRSEGTWEASITISPDYRGKGLSSAVLSVSEGIFSDSRPLRLTAAIHSSNLASKRLFARAGYLPHLPADEHGFELREKWLLR